jgi:hypothetical protein
MLVFSSTDIYNTASGTKQDESNWKNKHWLTIGWSKQWMGQSKQWMGWSE